MLKLIVFAASTEAFTPMIAARSEPGVGVTLSPLSAAVVTVKTAGASRCSSRSTRAGPANALRRVRELWDRRARKLDVSVVMCSDSAFQAT